MAPALLYNASAPTTSARFCRTATKATEVGDLENILCSSLLTRLTYAEADDRLLQVRSQGNIQHKL